MAEQAGWQLREVLRRALSGDFHPMNIERFLIDVCPFRVGHRVTIKAGAEDWRADWAGVEFVVVGISWEYQRGDGRINIAIATDAEIERGDGSTDGLRPDDLLPVARSNRLRGIPHSDVPLA